MSRDRPPAGIIPARAGFTWCAAVRFSVDGDHPRSRGVYDLGPIETRGILGSSPLARGLPVCYLNLALSERIIPARAGFTAVFYFDADYDRDHPRSRGVYPRAPTTMLMTPGSSPLARGLQD